MKVKHCFFLILFVLVIGSFFLALSVSPLIRASLKSFNKDSSFSSSKNAVRLTERGNTNVISVADSVSSSRALSPSITGPSNARAPVIHPPTVSASPHQSDSVLAAELTLCKSELNSIRSLVPVKDDSEDNLRAQLQEAQFKLKAAEEEIHRLQAQNPQQEEGSAASRCRIVERESNLCKSELRIVHSKVLSLHMLP
jgi:hypothetical protein